MRTTLTDIDTARRDGSIIGGLLFLLVLVLAFWLGCGCAVYNRLPTVTIGGTVGPGGAWVGFQSAPGENGGGRVRRLTFGLRGD